MCSRNYILNSFPVAREPQGSLAPGFALTCSPINWAIAFFLCGFRPAISSLCVWIPHLENKKRNEDKDTMKVKGHNVCAHVCCRAGLSPS